MDIIEDSNISRALAKTAKNPYRVLNDGLANWATGMNTSCDKRSQGKFVRQDFLTLDVQQIMAMYSENWAAARVVDILSEDMTREWRTFTDQDSSIDIKIIEKAERKLNLVKKFDLGMKWAKLFGGAVGYMLVDNSGDPDEPLDIENIKEGDLLGLHIVERPLVHISPTSTNFLSIHNPLSIDYQMPEFFTFAHNTSSTFQVHQSRIIVFHGHDTPRFNTTFDLSFWGLSVLEILRNALLNSQTIQDSVATMMTEANIDMVQIEGFKENMQREDGATMMLERFKNFNLMKSIVNMLVLDSKEMMTRSSINFTGLQPIVDQFLKILPAATGIPASKFLGESASGLSDTGKEDLRMYYDKIRNHQNRDMRPSLDKFDQVFLRSALGEIPDGLDWKFNSLWQEDPSVTADIEQKDAQTDQIYFDLGIVDEVQIARRLQASGRYEISNDDIEQMEQETEFKPDNTEISSDGDNTNNNKAAGNKPAQE